MRAAEDAKEARDDLPSLASPWLRCVRSLCFGGAPDLCQRPLVPARDIWRTHVDDGAGTSS